jgi:hypothetical protein
MPDTFTVKFTVFLVPLNPLTSIRIVITQCQVWPLSVSLSLSAYFEYLSVPDTEPSVSSVSLCPLLNSTVCPLSVSVSNSTVTWFFITMSTAVLYILSTVSVPHTILSVGSFSLCNPLSSAFCPLSVVTSHSTVCWFCVTTSTAYFYFLSVPHTLPSIGSV